MKVAHFCTFPHGGAAAAALRQHRGLLEAGIDSRFYYHRNQRAVELDPSCQQIDFPPPGYDGWTGKLAARRHRKRQRRIYDQFNRHLAVRPAGHETFAMAELPEPTSLDWSEIEADLVHLHWISYFADYPSFFRSIPNSVPLVWSLHDTHFFTGGCHYPGSCRRFTAGCGLCPQVAGGGEGDVSRSSWLAKQKALSPKNHFVTAPCQWMLDLAQASPIWPRNASFEKIEYGLDIEAYSPQEQAQARRSLGLADDLPVVAFGAMEIDNPRKGIGPLMEAIQQLGDRPIEFLAFGNGRLETGTGGQTPKIHELGFVDSVESKRAIYSAADVVVVPSLEDNQPQVGLEALACGTPVVAFDTSGLPEYVIHEQTGLLAPVADTAGLAAAIERLVEDRRMAQRLGRQGRTLVEQRFEMGQQTERVAQLYRRALGLKSHRRAAA